MSAEGTYCAGQLEVTTSPHEMRMSHWVYAPKVVNLLTGETVLDLTDGLWDLVGAVEREGMLWLSLQKYPDGRRGYQLSIDPTNGALSIDGKVLAKEQAERNLDGYV